ncbi:FAD:protein FMN transferase [Methylocystis sp. JAN1]|uniref:FAD:protein FMN transferase n=1 Tax=Methylocystis sp. JAN1 TaxID=3397211 RepID=UPI003FA23BD0
MKKLRQGLSRRRIIRIVAGAAGLALTDVKSPRSEEPKPVIWRGMALGALASIELHGLDGYVSRKLIQSSVDELERFERIFSLYRTDSSLSALNRTGSISRPPPDLVSLLSICLGYNRLTGGAFDPTVQPLWNLYRQHFSVLGADPNGPDEKRLREALSRVGCERMTIDADRIALDSGMALTLNGIAQGYITDRVTDLLRSEGVKHTLVDLGEIRAIGRRSDGRRWVVGLEDPDRVGATADTLEIENCAVATSGGYGFRFDQFGRFSHLFDPSTGKSPQLYKSVSVISPTATMADALSTAFSSMQADAIDRVLSRVEGECKVSLTFADGRMTWLEPRNKQQ